MKRCNVDERCPWKTGKKFSLHDAAAGHSRLSAQLGYECSNTEAESKVTPFCFLTGIPYILPRWYSGKESTCQGRRRKRLNSVPGSERSLGEAMAIHSSILAWSIPWTEEPGGYSQ